MYDNNVIYEYCAIDSVIHRLSFICKFISLIFSLVLLFLANSLLDILFILLFLFLFVMFSDIGIRIYINNLYVAKVLIFLVFIFSLIFSGDIFVSIINSIKIIYLVIYLSCMIMTTSFKSILYGFLGILYPFRNFMDINSISLNIGLYSRFFIILYNERIRIRNSKELRGINFSNIGFRDKIIGYFDNIILGYKNCNDKINRIKTAMRVRNYGCFSGSSNYRLNKFGKIDTIVLGINVVVLILVIIY